MAPLSPDQDRPQASEWEQEISRLAQTPVAALRAVQIQSASSTEMKRALDIDAGILRPSTNSEEMFKSAQRLAARHQEHFIAPAFVSVVLRLIKDPTDETARKELQLIRQKANESGFFIMNYTPQIMADRLSSPNYVIAEASGRHPNKNHPSFHNAAPGADCQVWLPEATENPSEILSLPTEGDIVWEEGIVEDCKRRPWAFAEVKDIASNLSMNNTGLAGAARSCAFRHIENVINPTRGDYPIEYVGAEIAMLKGIILPDGSEFRLENLGEPESVKNGRSLIIHFLISDNKATETYNLKNRVVPVEYEGQQYKILVNWLMGIHKLKKSSSTSSSSATPVVDVEPKEDQQ